MKFFSSHSVPATPTAKVFLLRALLMISLYGCKYDTVNYADTSSSDAPLEDDSVEYRVSLNWSTEKNKTVVKVFDETGLSNQARVLAINMIPVTGKLTTLSHPTKFNVLGKKQIGNSEPTLPVMDVELVYRNHHQWCYTANPIFLGSEGKIRCYKETSDRGKFVSNCLSGGGRVRHTRTELKCQSYAKPETRGDYTFLYGDGSKGDQTVANLEEFRSFQSLCLLSSNKHKLDKTAFSKCHCVHETSSRQKKVDLWAAARYLTNTPDREKVGKFEVICQKHIDISSIADSDSSLTENKKLATRRANAHACKILKFLNLAIDDSSVAQDKCKCKSFQSDSVTSNQVLFTDLSTPEFMNKCLNLKNITEAGHLCKRIGMQAIPDVKNVTACRRNTPNEQTKARCNIQSSLALTAIDCLNF